nr:NADH dehydrogenase subunit 5 [Nedyopus patrioticus unicolor]
MYWLLSGVFFMLITFSVWMMYHGMFLIGESALIFDWVIFRVFGMDMGVTFLFDWMSLVFMSVVLMISGCVFYYMVGYMSGEKNIVRFGLLVFLFVLSMVFVIISPSFITILLGWDGLGLVSYCLVIYYGNFSSFNAGMITGISNRIGDVGLLMAVGFLFMYGSWDFYLIESSEGIMWLVSIFIVLAGFTKSAQIPFSAWLPAAMAAPTPVSALVHSSTLVTAGVYLFIRFYGVLGSVWWLMLIILYSGVMTLFMAGLSANFEQDMSKIIALSTLSQLGVMMVSIGVGNVGLAFFHLVCHAIFKALLFLCGGSMIHSFSGSQDVRFMGGVVVGLPITCVCLNVANLSLCGLPFMAGFYSSDLVLEGVGGFGANVFLFLILMLGTLFTCFYTVSFCWFSMISYYSGGSFTWDDCDLSYILPMVILSFGGVVGGSLYFWLGVPSQDFFFVFGAFSVWPFLVVVFGFIFSWLLVVEFKSWSSSMRMSDYWFSMWYIPNLSVESPGFYLNLGGSFTGLVDLGWGEMFGGQGLSSKGWMGSKVVNKFQSVVFGVSVFLIVLWMVFMWYFFVS